MSRKLTIVSATQREVQPLLDHLDQNAKRLSASSFLLSGIEMDILISGIGIMETTFSLMEYLHYHLPDAWLQLGIGGAYDQPMKIGDVCAIEKETIYGFGAEDRDGRIMNPFELGWMDPDTFPYTNGTLHCPYITDQLLLPRAHGVTVFHSHGHEPSILSIKENRPGQIENMEGAAFFYVSLKKQIPFLSIRAISNHVETRDVSKWEIDLAIANLCENAAGNILNWCQELAG